jgi:hypothetical protein
MPTFSDHHYAFDSVGLLDDCIEKLQETIDKDVRGRQFALYDLKEALVLTEQLLHGHVLYAIEKEKKGLEGNIELVENYPSCLSSSVASLKGLLHEKKRQREADNRNVHFRDLQNTRCYYPSRSASDTLLFRLIVELQLCSVRIDDAYYVITGHHRLLDNADRLDARLSLLMVAGCVAGAGVAAVSMRRSQNKLESRDLRSMVVVSAKLGAAVITATWARTWARNYWMTDKIIRSMAAIEDWQKQWQMVQTTACQPIHHREQTEGQQDAAAELLDAKSRRLIEYAMMENPKV